VIRSDEIRKRLCGVSPSVHLGAAGYTEAISKRVYDTLSTQAGTVVQQGYSAILDAVFARSSDRRAVEGIAQIAGVPFVGLWLNAPEFVLLTRAQHRLADDPSDADAEVIRQQLGKDVGPIAWRRIDASVSAEHVLREAFAISAGAANDVQSRVSA
jgi:predicted kinase